MSLSFYTKSQISNLKHNATLSMYRRLRSYILVSKKQILLGQKDRNHVAPAVFCGHCPVYSSRPYHIQRNLTNNPRASMSQT